MEQQVRELFVVVCGHVNVTRVHEREFCQENQKTTVDCEHLAGVVFAISGKRFFQYHVSILLLVVFCT